MSSLKSYNPATGELVGELATASTAEVEQVIENAKAAQVAWGQKSLKERRDCILQVAPVFIERAEELGELLSREMGKPLPEGIGEVRSCGAGLNEKLEEIEQALSPEILEDKHSHSEMVYDPYGVCAAITPWNFPIAMPHWMVIPALMAGNSVILKASEETPLIAQAYVDIFQQFLPENVLQSIHGADEQGKALVNGDVDLIAFTGSRETGKKILASAASSLKRVMLELGGKDPLVVLEDADVEKAAKFAAMNSFRNAGQVCVSTERIYVAESIADEFTQKVGEVCKSLKVGNPLEEGTQIGPMISQQQKAHVVGQLESALEQGATRVAGPSEHPDQYVMPTVLSNLSHDMDIMEQETFGPIACIMSFKDEEEALRLANDTPFGLGAAVFGSPEKAQKLGRKLTAAMVGINRGCGGASGTPWVGAKESGYGYHNSTAGHRQFAQVRVISRAQAESK